MTDVSIPDLRPDLLSTTIPTTVYAGGAVDTPADMLFLWRSVATEKARSATLAFYLDDERLEAVWRSPTRYAAQFKACGVKAAVEVDFSLWTDRPLEEQRHNVFRTRTVSRVFQSVGLLVAPNLNWSTPASYDFCFQGIPVGAPVCMTECRTAGGCQEDREAFLLGLHAAVERVRPQTLVIYGGARHQWWIERDLPVSSTAFVFLESWTDARRRVRAEQERQERDHNQLSLFGGDQWADVVAQAA